MIIVLIVIEIIVNNNNLNCYYSNNTNINLYSVSSHNNINNIYCINIYYLIIGHTPLLCELGDNDENITKAVLEAKM